MKTPFYGWDGRFIAKLEIRDSPEALVWVGKFFVRQEDDSYVEVHKLPEDVIPEFVPASKKKPAKTSDWGERLIGTDEHQW